MKTKKRECRTCKSNKFYDKIIGKNPNLVKNNTNSKILKKFSMLLKKSKPIVQHKLMTDNTIIVDFRFTIKG